VCDILSSIKEPVIKIFLVALNNLILVLFCIQWVLIFSAQARHFKPIPKLVSIPVLKQPKEKLLDERRILHQ
jgi:hypothetical protein